MNDAAIKDAEQRGYGRGYAAGHRRKKQIESIARDQRKKDAFWQRAFLAALPATIVAENWKSGVTPIVSLSARVKLAADAADEAMIHVVSHI